MAQVATEESDVFSDRDEKYMRAFLDLAVKWADERPDAAPTGLSIMGTSLLSIAVNGPKLDDRTDGVELSARATNLVAQERPHDALDEILSEVSSLQTQQDSNDRSNDTGSEQDSSEGADPERASD
ncbi:hypothetical protein [Salinibacter ruber]|uniref:Uncharacterized protein n=1 Tax=Salinibacter ruber TaxID=146919 RepID=A0A9X2TIU4_9BACT|nr:hypothetical protein [Salinibacter ruber]MCS3661743.1 hypothetical protein [Salinibacter ruber]MCS3711596.1 hypothetical protein [Salinibacter ruber]